VVEFFGRRLFERSHFAALRIQTRHYVLDRAVFARRVHRLKNYQQRVIVLRVKHCLEVRKRSTFFRKSSTASFLSV
jgi:hypothetical protein